MKKKRALTDRDPYSALPLATWHEMVSDWSKFRVEEKNYYVWSWCKDNCQGKFDMKTGGYWFIERKDDAVLFALRWL